MLNFGRGIFLHLAIRIHVFGVETNSLPQTTHYCGIFTYIYHKRQPFMQVNIPVPWILFWAVVIFKIYHNPGFRNPPNWYLLCGFAEPKNLETSTKTPIYSTYLKKIHPSFRCLAAKRRATCNKHIPWDSNHHYNNGCSYNHHCLPQGLNHRRGSTIFWMVVEAQGIDIGISNERSPTYFGWKQNNIWQQLELHIKRWETETVDAVDASA